jgi:hypothetical protein
MSALTYRAIERRFLQRKALIACWSAAEAPISVQASGSA